MRPIDRLPPHSIEAEQGVLGCLMSDQQVRNTGFSESGFGKEWFYDLRHQQVFDVLRGMHYENRHIDALTLVQQLKDIGQLEAVGGLAYVLGLQDVIPSPHNLPYYLGIVREKFQLRKMVQACTETVARIYENEGDPQSVLDEAERAVMAVRIATHRHSMQGVKELIHEAIGEIEMLHGRQGAISGLATGFVDFDKMHDGMHGSEMIVIAGYPSSGKTSFAMNIAEHVAVDQNQAVGIFSLEMSAKAIVMRLLCSRARINLRCVRDGFLAERDFPNLTGAAGRIAQSKMYFEDVSDLSVMQFRSKARQMVQEHGIKLFVVDYLQLMNAGGTTTSREQEVSSISKGVKATAKELNVPVIALSQLNDDGKLRESRAIGQDADTVAILQKADSDEGQFQDAIGVRLNITKQRNGPVGSIGLTFLRQYTRFESASKIDQNEYRIPYV